MLEVKGKNYPFVLAIENHFTHSLPFGEELKEDAVEMCRKKMLEICLTIKITVILCTFVVLVSF